MSRTEEERIINEAFLSWSEEGSMREKLRQAVREAVRVCRAKVAETDENEAANLDDLFPEAFSGQK